jgi:hypothetical protein
MPYVGSDFSPRDAGETFVLELDFARDILATGDVITAAAWSMGLLQGIDAAPNHASGAATFSGTKTQQKFTGCAPACLYEVQATATMQSGDVLILWARLRVRAPGSVSP